MKRMKIFLSLITIAQATQITQNTYAQTCSSKQKMAQQKVVTGCNNFACNLYTQLKQENKDKNIFFSPYSISNALSIAYAGANGSTKTEMQNVLCDTLSRGNDQEQFHQTYAQIINDLNETTGNFTLNIANKLFIQSGFPIYPEFEKVIKSNYGAAFDIVDFINNPDATSNFINNWVSEKTLNKINNIISPELLDKETKMVIANAIYFKGKWENQFKTYYTKQQPFYIDKNKKINVEMMEQKNKFYYMENDKLQLLELPYEGKRLSMFIILPKNTDYLETIEKELSQDNMSKYLENMQKTNIEVNLPKFKIETTYDELRTTLDKIGMHSAFDIETADFTKISPESRFYKNGALHNLYISDIIHKAFIEIDEEGTEAAAATVTISKECRASRTEEAPIKFNANHPFCFFIFDKYTGLVLFSGRVKNPKE